MDGRSGQKLGGEGAEVVGEPLGEGSTQEGRAHQCQRHEERAGRRLDEIEKGAAGDERNDRAQGQEGRAHQQERRYPLMAHQPPAHDQVGPGQSADEGPAESGDQEHQVIRAQGRHNSFQHNRHCMPEHVARGGKVKHRAGVPIGMI